MKNAIKLHQFYDLNYTTIKENKSPDVLYTVDTTAYAIKAAQKLSHTLFFFIFVAPCFTYGSP